MRREVGGGVTTFLAMAYILFVQPAMLGAAGMDTGAVLTATCLGSALATLIMGIWARYPVALTPADGPQPFLESPCVPSLTCTGHGPGCTLGF